MRRWVRGIQCPSGVAVAVSSCRESWWGARRPRPPRPRVASGRRLCLLTAAATACPAHNWRWEARGAPKVGGVAAKTTSAVTVVLPPRFATRNGGASVGVSGDDGTRRRRRGRWLRRSAATQVQMTVCPSGQFPRRGLGVVVWLLLRRGGPVGRYWTRRAVGDSPFRLRGIKLTPPPPVALLPTRATRPLHTPCTKAHQRMMLPGVTRSFAIFQVLVNLKSKWMSVRRDLIGDRRVFVTSLAVSSLVLVFTFAKIRKEENLDLSRTAPVTDLGSTCTRQYIVVRQSFSPRAAK